MSEEPTESKGQLVCADCGRGSRTDNVALWSRLGGPWRCIDCAKARGEWPPIIPIDPELD